MPSGISPGGRPINESPLGKGKNWVTERGGLPPYIRGVARSIMKKRGKTKSEAIAIAIGAMRHWAAGGGNVSAAVRAAAIEALARWDAMKGSK